MTRPAIRLTAHERLLIGLYRLAPIDVRLSVDRVVFDGVNGESRRRSSLVLRRVHADHLMGSPLTGFATYWLMKG